MEDNPADAYLVRFCCRDRATPIELEVVTSGEAALHRLRQAASGVSCPRLVLLDLNLPRLSGHDLLFELSRDPGGFPCPVVVFSSSSDEWDIRRSRELGAADYIAKPSDLASLEAVIEDALDRWVLPRREPATLPH